MSIYKLHYFDIRARGEPIRLLFRLADQPFIDARIPRNQWIELKKTMPLKQVPVLEVDGVPIAQSPAIARFLANQFNLNGRTPLECARLDMIGETVQDFMNSTGRANFPRVALGVIKMDMKEYYKEHVVPDIQKFAPKIEQFLIENGNNGLFVGDKVTWVDVFSAESFSQVVDFGSSDALEAYPSIEKQIKYVFNLPKIKDYISSRKPTVF